MKPKQKKRILAKEARRQGATSRRQAMRAWLAAWGMEELWQALPQSLQESLVAHHWPKPEVRFLGEPKCGDIMEAMRHEILEAWVGAEVVPNESDLCGMPAIKCLTAFCPFAQAFHKKCSVPGVDENVKRAADLLLGLAGGI
ncbi:MAG: hypothetical protein NTX84_09030, partial [Nitrospirae bacterium]|nr:hypothetical protein [Nitrospirota bacterium]